MMAEVLELAKIGGGELIMGVFAGVLWIVSLKPRLETLEKTVEKLEEDQNKQVQNHDALALEIRTSLSDIKASQARVEGWISGREGKLQ